MDKRGAELVIQTVLTLLTAVGIYMMIDISSRISDLATSMAVMATKVTTLEGAQVEQKGQLGELRGVQGEIGDRVKDLEVRIDNTRVRR